MMFDYTAAAASVDVLRLMCKFPSSSYNKRKREREREKKRREKTEKE
jgi:hypothetical protein